MTRPSRRLALRPALAVALLLCAGHAAAREVYLPDGGLTREKGFPSQAGGLRLEASLEGFRFEAGEAIDLTCTLTNLGEEALLLEKPLQAASPPDYAYVTDHVGRALVSSLHVSNPGEWRPGRSLEPWTMLLEPGESHSYTIDLDRFYRSGSVPDMPLLDEPHLGRPGSFRAQCFYTRWQDYGHHPVWKGNLASAPVPFRRGDMESTRPGLHVETSLPGDTFGAGSPIRVLCTVTNETRSRLHVLRPEWTRAGTDAFVQVVHSTGEVLKPVDGSTLPGQPSASGGNDAVVALARGASLSFEIDLAEAFAGGPETKGIHLGRPGLYEVRCGYAQTLIGSHGLESGYGRPLPVWKGRVLGERRRFRVVAPR